MKKVYCTPAITADRTTLHYELSESGLVDITLYSIEGRAMLNYSKNQETGIHTHEIDLRGFSDGVYLCKLVTGTQMQTIRIVKK